MIAVYLLFVGSLGYTIFRYSAKRKIKRDTDKLIDELDEICEEMKESLKNSNPVDIIKKNQVELARELNEERQNTL